MSTAQLQEHMKGMTVEEIQKILSTMPEFKDLKIKKAKEAPFKVKFNKKGGLYVSSPKFEKAWSENNSKYYQPSVNIPAECLAIFKDREVFEAIMKLLTTGEETGA